MAKLRVEWTDKAKAQLKQIHDYLKYEKKTLQGAANVRNDLIRASKEVTYAEQYQKDNVNKDKDTELLNLTFNLNNLMPVLLPHPFFVH